MSLAKTTLWNGLAVAIRLATQLALNKVLAVLVGPSGYALIGQLQNAIQVLFAASAGAINNGVTKYTAEFAGNDGRESELWSTAMRMVLVASGVVAVATAVLHRPLAEFFLRSQEYATVFLWLAASLPLFTLNTMLQAILNGRKELKTFVASNIAGSVLILVAMSALTVGFGLYGALVALAINQALVFFVTIALVARKRWFGWARFRAPGSRKLAYALAGFAVMAAVSAIANNAGLVGVRTVLIERFGLAAAGQWDGMTKISQINMLLVATTMSFYFIPRISEITFFEDVRAEVAGGMRLILPLFAAGAAALYLLRDPVILLLFTPEFAPMRDLFAWQLAGDTVRVTTWFLAYVMIGKAMIATYVATEILTNVLLVAAAWVLTGLYGFESVALAHFVTYSVGLVGMIAAVVAHPGLPRRATEID